MRPRLILGVGFTLALVGCETGANQYLPPPQPVGPRAGLWFKQLDDRSSVSFEVLAHGSEFYLDYFVVNYSGVCVIYNQGSGTSTPRNATGEYWICDVSSSTRVDGENFVCDDASILFTDFDGTGYSRAVVSFPKPTVCFYGEYGPSPPLPDTSAPFEVLF